MLAIAQTAQREHWPERLQARIACVISNRPQAAGLAKAAELGLATQVVDHTLYENQSHPREAFDSALMQAIDASTQLGGAGGLYAHFDAWVCGALPRAIAQYPPLTFAGIHRPQHPSTGD